MSGIYDWTWYEHNDEQQNSLYHVYIKHILIPHWPVMYVFLVTKNYDGNR